MGCSFFMYLLAISGLSKATISTFYICIQQQVNTTAIHQKGY
jgi:hypothetical protein